MEELLNYLSQQKAAIFCKKNRNCPFVHCYKAKTCWTWVFLQDFSKFSAGGKTEDKKFQPNRTSRDIEV